MAVTDQPTVDLDRIRRAAAAGEGVVRRTPVLSSRTLGERVGGTIALKAENLQRTGSFKLRGVLSKLAALGDAAAAGVVTGSAGNHAQAVAYAARSRGLPCEVFMPREAPTAKVDACMQMGATVHFVDGVVDDALRHAYARAAEAGLAVVHPFDDPDVVAGQGSVGLELLDKIPDLARVIVPVGGGGLASGIATAIRLQRPEVDVIGVQAERCHWYPASRAQGEPVAVEKVPLTIADGIAVKRPGDLTLPLLRTWLADVVAVGEDAIADAMVLLLERAKLVVEGAGAVGVAALLAGVVEPAAQGTTAVVLSGGNVDAGLLASVARLHETTAGRRLAVRTTISDRPGELGRLLVLVGAQGANLVDVSHVREGIDLHVRETGVQLVLETRGPQHAREVLAAIAAAGYEAVTLS
jgi:threonine dehydratase